jgi:hypothetical protein
MTVATAGTTRELAAFPSNLRFESLPREVVDRTEEFFFDWIASALAGRNQDGASPGEIRWIIDREPEVRDLLPGV